MLCNEINSSTEKMEEQSNERRTGSFFYDDEDRHRMTSSFCFLISPPPSPTCTRRTRQTLNARKYPYSSCPKDVVAMGSTETPAGAKKKEFDTSIRETRHETQTISMLLHDEVQPFVPNRRSSEEFCPWVNVPRTKHPLTPPPNQKTLKKSLAVLREINVPHIVQELRHIPIRLKPQYQPMIFPHARTIMSSEIPSGGIFCRQPQPVV